MIDFVEGSQPAIPPSGLERLLAETLQHSTNTASSSKAASNEACSSALHHLKSVDVILEICMPIQKKDS